MDTQAKIQQARDAGYSDDEISQYMNQKGLQGSPSVMGGGSAGGVAHNVSNFLNNVPGLGGWANSLLGAAYEGSRAIGTKLGAKNLYTNQQGQTVQDPFLSSQDLSVYHPGGGVPLLAKTASNIAGAAGDAATLAGIPGLLGGVKNLFLGGLTKKIAGAKIGSLIADAESMPNKQGTIDSLLEKHFGTAANPNTELLPNAPAQEQGSLLRLLKKEIYTQGRGEQGGTDFADLQNWKSGSGAKGKFDNSVTTSTQRLFQNISRAYGNVLNEAIPDIAKPYAQYAKIAKAEAQHGTGIKGILSKTLLGGGYGGWLLRQNLAYPVIDQLRSGAMNLLNGAPPPVEPSPPSNNTFSPTGNSNTGFANW